MIAPTRGADRVFRVLVLSQSSLLLAGGAHLAGGGGSPSAGALVLAAGLVIMVAAAVTARRCRLPLLLFVVGAEQLGLHVIFGAGAGAGAVAGACAPASLLGHAHAGSSATCSPAASTVAGSGDATIAMVVAHLLAVLVTACLLSRGEAWLWSAADLIIQAAALLPALVRIPAVSPQPVGLTTQRPTRLAGSPAAPRGPPLPRR
jgi:hypothetical protein